MNRVGLPDMIAQAPQVAFVYPNEEEQQVEVDPPFDHRAIVLQIFKKSRQFENMVRHHSRTRRSANIRLDAAEYLICGRPHPDEIACRYGVTKRRVFQAIREQGQLRTVVKLRTVSISLRPNCKMEDFFSRESEVLKLASVALDDAVAAFEAEVRAHRSSFAGADRLNALLAKGLTKLSKAEESECLTLVKQLKASCAPLDAKFEQLKKQFAAHSDRLRSSIKSIRERTGFEEREADKQRVRQVEQIGGLLAYGLANASVSEASPWRFARSLVAISGRVRIWASGGGFSTNWPRLCRPARPRRRPKGWKTP